MGQTALQLVQTACYEANIPAPTALVGATDTSVLQLLTLFYATGRELRTSKCWAQLKRQHSIILEPNRRTYQLPQDFYTIIPSTPYDSRTSWSVHNALTDAEANGTRYGWGSTGTRVAFRIIGAENANDGRGQIELDRVPGDGDAGERITFEYITRSWLSPPLWTASETVAQNTWRTSYGRNYKKTDAGSEAGDVIPPNMAFGIGAEGSVTWYAISPTSWANDTVYAAGSYVLNTGKYYKAIVSGQSAPSGGPSGTSSSITDNTVVWKYIDIPEWTAYTAYEKGDHVYYATFFYTCLEGGTSGRYYPRFTSTTISDNLITWTFQPTAYEALVTDSDLCNFDDELMIAGLKWRFLRARGLAYEDLLGEYEQLKDSAASRWNPGKILRLGRPLARAVNYPLLPDGDF